MAEATYDYIDAPPGMEIFNCTSAPANGSTITSRKLTNPLPIGSFWTEAAAAADSLSAAVSGQVATLTVIGTARTFAIIFVENSPV